MKKILPIEKIVGLKKIWGISFIYRFMLENYGLLWWHFTENRETKLVQQLIPPGATAIDVGANIGYYTLLLSKAVGPNGKVFAFEPDIENFNLLQKNIKRYNCNNVICLNQAVCDHTGQVQLYLSEKNPGDHRIYDLNKDRKSVTVSAVRLDDYFSNYPKKIDFIKIDVQGAEESVIRGMSELLKDRVKTEKLVMLAEFWPAGLKNFGVNPPEKYLTLLEQHGFSIQYVVKNNLKKLDSNKVSMEDWNNKYTNLLCVR